MEGYTEWEYKVVKDEFFLYFPEGEYDIHTLAEWYKTIPTHPETIAYYGDRIDLLKQHFSKYINFKEINTKWINDFSSNPVLYVWCLAIYNSQMELVGFAAEENNNNLRGEKKILYFGELRE